MSNKLLESLSPPLPPQKNDAAWGWSFCEQQQEATLNLREGEINESGLKILSVIADSVLIVLLCHIPLHFQIRFKCYGNHKLYLVVLVVAIGILTKEKQQKYDEPVIYTRSNLNHGFT